MSRAAADRGVAFRGRKKAITGVKTPVPAPEFRGIVSRLICAVIAIFCLVASAAAFAVDSAPHLPELQVQTLAPGVHVLRAPGFEVNADNAGFITNIGVIEDARGLVLVGTGTSHRFAQHLLTSVERHFGRPVVLAVVLYGGGDHVLGNGVFVARGVPVVAQTETDRFIRASCHSCVERLTAALGENMMSSTEPTPATVVVERTARLVGLVPGLTRRLTLIHLGHTFQPGASALYDEQSGTLFAGELGASGYLPDLYNALETGWRGALTELAALGAKRVVPAHGAPGGSEVLTAPKRYLESLIAQTGALFEQGVSLQEATQSVEVAEFRDWYGYAVWHRRNVHFAYLHREQEAFGQRGEAAPGLKEGQH